MTNKLQLLDKLIKNYSDANPELIDYYGQGDVSNTITKKLVTKEYGFALTYFQNNLYRLKVVRFIVELASTNLLFKKKIMKEIGELIEEGSGAIRLWAAILFSYLRKSDRNKYEEEYAVSSISFSNDEAAFLFGGVNLWQINDNQEFDEFKQLLAEKANASGLLD